MQDNTATTSAPAPAPANPLAPVANPTLASLLVLTAALKKAQNVELVTEEENQAKIKAAAKEAKALLKAYRAENEPVEEEPADDEVTDTNSFGMGIQKANNANITPDQQRQIDLATEQFKQSVTRVDNQILNQYIQAVQDGNYAEAEAILDKAEQSQQTNTLTFALLTIGAILLPLYAKQRLQALFVHFGLNTVFAQTKSGQDAMKLQAERGAKSHVHTIAKDIKNALDDAIDTELTNPTIEAAVKDKYEALAQLDDRQYIKAVHSDEDIYAYAREQILSGASRQTVIKNLQTNFAGVGQRRANVIAGNEANRVFTMSQFDADKQFLAQNKLTDKAYKRLVSNTGHPEAICKAIIDATAIHPIPFTNDFLPFGKVFTTTGDNGKKIKFTPNYEKLQSGHIHVNCHCRYELLIKQENGSFLNTYDFKTLNDAGFEADLHPRDDKGKFAKKGSGIIVDLTNLDNVGDFNAFIHTAKKDDSLGQFPEDVTDAVTAYQGHYYEAINAHAREGYSDDTLIVLGKTTTFGKTIDNIDSAANLTLAKDHTFYRGTEIPYHQTNSVGDAIDARSFLSTSTSQKIANNFKAPGGSMVVVNAKKGQKIILPDYVTTSTTRNPMGEAEVLTPTNSTLTITRIEGDTVYADLN